jgi:hypothetical protein
MMKKNIGREDVMFRSGADRVGWGIVLTAALLGPVSAAVGRVDTSPQAQRQIDAQVRAIVSGLRRDVGALLRDGSMIRSVELDGRIIRIVWQMPFDKYATGGRADLRVLRGRLQRDFCSGNTAKLFPYGVGWDYQFIDAKGFTIGLFRITDCDGF